MIPSEIEIEILGKRDPQGTLGSKGLNITITDVSSNTWL